MLGPSVFPTLVGVPAMVLSALIALFPGGTTSWPARHRVLRQGVAVAILIAYAYLLQPLGVPLATGLLIGSVAWLMGGPPIGSLLLGALGGRRGSTCCSTGCSVCRSICSGTGSDEGHRMKER